MNTLIQVLVMLAIMGFIIVCFYAVKTDYPSLENATYAASTLILVMLTPLMWYISGGSGMAAIISVAIATIATILHSAYEQKQNKGE